VGYPYLFSGYPTALLTLEFSIPLEQQLFFSNKQNWLSGKAN
jgi:hypothetical protein